MKSGQEPAGNEPILVVTCACGFETRGTKAELIPVVQRHGMEAHNMKVTPDDVLAMARPA